MTAARVALCLGLSGLGAGGALASTSTWVGLGPTSAWGTAQNWAPAATPGLIDDVVIDNAALSLQPFIRNGEAFTVASATLSAGRLILAGDFTSSVITITGQGRLDVLASGDVVGRVENSRFGGGGFVSLCGDLTGSLDNGGMLELCASGSRRITGNLTQQPFGTTQVDLRNAAAGASDRLAVSGSVNLAGALAVNLPTGTVLNEGDSFIVMTWGQRLGNSQFTRLDLSQAQGYTFTTDYNTNDLTLKVVGLPVPEPGTWALMAAGLLGLGMQARVTVRRLDATGPRHHG